MEFRFLFLSPEKSKVPAAQTGLDLGQMTLFLRPGCLLTWPHPPFEVQGVINPQIMYKIMGVCAFSGLHCWHHIFKLVTSYKGDDVL